MNITKQEQIQTMETQLKNFDSMIEKMSYMKLAFDNDPMFSKEARDIVRSNIAKTLNHR